MSSAAPSLRSASQRTSFRRGRADVSPARRCPHGPQSFCRLSYSPPFFFVFSRYGRRHRSGTLTFPDVVEVRAITEQAPGPRRTDARRLFDPSPVLGARKTVAHLSHFLLVGSGVGRTELPHIGLCHSAVGEPGGLLKTARQPLHVSPCCCLTCAAGCSLTDRHSGSFSRRWHLEDDEKLLPPPPPRRHIQQLIHNPLDEPVVQPGLSTRRDVGDAECRAILRQVSGLSGLMSVSLATARRSGPLAPAGHNTLALKTQR
ncbi:unnamed protein product [Gadus morhua 'NCC']